MRRLAAFSMLLLLLQSLGAGVALGQVPGDTAHAHCTTAPPSDTGAHVGGHSGQPDDATSGDHCSMPWMTSCGSSSACTGQAMRVTTPVAHVPIDRATAGRPRNSLAPDSPSAELEAPPPRD